MVSYKWYLYIYICIYIEYVYINVNVYIYVFLCMYVHMQGNTWDVMLYSDPVLLRVATPLKLVTSFTASVSLPSPRARANPRLPRRMTSCLLQHFASSQHITFQLKQKEPHDQLSPWCVIQQVVSRKFWPSWVRTIKHSTKATFRKHHQARKHSDQLAVRRLVVVVVAVRIMSVLICTVMLCWH